MFIQLKRHGSQKAEELSFYIKNKYNIDMMTYEGDWSFLNFFIIQAIDELHNIFLSLAINSYFPPKI